MTSYVGMTVVKKITETISLFFPVSQQSVVSCLLAYISATDYQKTYDIVW